MPLGTQVHNIELRLGKGGQIVRSAGGYAQLMAKEGNYALLKLPSGEVRKVLLDCRATVGQWAMSSTRTCLRQGGARAGMASGRTPGAWR